MEMIKFMDFNILTRSFAYLRINGDTYIKGVDKTIHNKGFRYPFGFMDGAVRVIDAEDTRKRANWLWLGKKGNW